MKKKKLKKKLKQLKRQIEEEKRREINLSNWTMAKVDELKKITNEIKVDLKAEEYKEKDNRINILWEWMQRSGIDFHDWGKTPVYAEEVVYTEDIQRQINEINNRLRVLDARTRTDYTQFSSKEFQSLDIGHCKSVLNRMISKGATRDEIKTVVDIFNKYVFEEKVMEVPTNGN
ncbi:MAG: hypothetical protein J6Y02_20955 [Pseudobutyrivibrio sp.]|nr:hypothetical protein [Pseudobutyrivibrio sp.]